MASGSFLRYIQVDISQVRLFVCKGTEYQNLHSFVFFIRPHGKTFRDICCLLTTTLLTFWACGFSFEHLLCLVVVCLEFYRRRRRSLTISHRSNTTRGALAATCSASMMVSLIWLIWCRAMSYLMCGWVAVVVLSGVHIWRIAHHPLAPIFSHVILLVAFLLLISLLCAGPNLVCASQKHPFSNQASGLIHGLYWLLYALVLVSGVRTGPI